MKRRVYKKWFGPKMYHRLTRKNDVFFAGWHLRWTHEGEQLVKQMNFADMIARSRLSCLT